MEISEIKVGDELWWCRAACLAYDTEEYRAPKPLKVKVTHLYPKGEGIVEVTLIWNQQNLTLLPTWLFRTLEDGWVYVRQTLLDLRKEVIEEHELLLKKIDTDLEQGFNAPT